MPIVHKIEIFSTNPTISRMTPSAIMSSPAASPGNSFGAYPRGRARQTWGAAGTTSWGAPVGFYGRGSCERPSAIEHLGGEGASLGGG
jgi:hypothetical protein